jgi:hypothetical protein
MGKNAKKMREKFSVFLAIFLQTDRKQLLKIIVL